jgi:serine protease AprX
VVNNTEFVYGFDSHGTSVLSLMAGFIPGQYIGTAPEADYWLIRTEDADTEYIIEEYNWVSGAEIADSAGVDVINTSLGYTQFDAASQNHTYADMDGHTAVISIGADIAFSKGMLVVVAAGNSGSDSWHYISAPADARGVLAVGATFPDGSLAAFSSRGPSADQRVKPNVSGQGAICYVAEPDGSFGYGSGTSYASPVMAGMSACLWSARKSITNQELKELIESVSSQYTDPDDDLGYGIPDFEEAYLKLTNSGFNTQKTNNIRIYPNPFNETLRFDFRSGSDTNLDIELRDQLGRTVLFKHSTVLPNQLNQVEWNGLENLAKGMYLVRIGNNDAQVTGKVIKQ